MIPASMAQRLAGAVVDGLVMAPVSILLTRHAWETEEPAWGWVATGAVVAYQVVLTALSGQTLGKRLLRTRVVRDLPGPSPTACGWSGAVSRHAVLVLPGLLPVVGGAASALVPVAVLVSMAVDDLRRGLHDRIAGTRVIDVGEGVPLTDRYRANLRVSAADPRPVRKRRRATPFGIG